MSDIKTSDVFPEGVDPSQLTISAECIYDFYDDGVQPNDHAAHCINSYDKLVSSMDDLELYIGDADMKNDDLQARIAELEGVVSDLLLGSNHEFLTVNAIRINAQQALKDNS